MRTRLVECFHRLGLRPWEIVRLRLSDVVDETHSGRVLIRARETLTTTHRVVPMDYPVRVLIESYVNYDEDPDLREGAPFHDWRPDIGRYLFPSPHHQGHISYGTVIKTLRKKRETDRAKKA